MNLKEKLKMKLVLAIMTLLAVSAEAGVQFFNTAGTNLGVRSRVQCGTNVTCTMTAGKLNIAVGSGDLVGDGGDQFYGFLQNQIASTTTTLTAGECGSTIVSNSADVVGLPEASTVLGCRYTFVCGTADDFDVNPDNADIIGPVNSVAAGTGTAITPSAGDAIRCTDIGSSITLEAVAADRWVTIGVANGAWTDVN